MAKQEKFSNTSSQENATFNKGMVKDISDTYMSEGMWINAINAINNSHQGESGNIGNEMANKYCQSAPYTIIGMAHKIHKQWVLFSTNNTDSEIGIFDEATCSYLTVVNDQCLNFNQANLITSVVKENYDCTWSVYWQDNRNPDRVMNLDDPPFICLPAQGPPLIDEEINFYNWDISLDPDPVANCGGDLDANGNNNPQSFDIELGTDWGLVQLDFNAWSQVDRFVVTWNGQVVIDTGFVGNNPCGGTVDYTTNGQPHPLFDLGQGPHPSSTSAGAGTAAFLKNADVSTMTLDVIPGPCSGTLWNCSISCVQPDPRAVRPVPQPIEVPYVDSQGVPQTVTLQPGDSTTICSEAKKLEDFESLPTDPRFNISGGIVVCDTITRQVPDPNFDYCTPEECTDDLDCDELRLHPLIVQPCVDIKKAQGTGQIQSGSYMAVVAYAENGIKLTDYSTPSIPVAIWDHSGIGGGLEVNVSNLDEDYNEYELVVIGVVNQQTVAKRVGFYSTDQTRVTIDALNQSLVTIPLSSIPAKSAIYEKSEKMSTVNNYLIRSGVTTQPFLNYQPLANEIITEWVCHQYEDGYYRDGGKKTGYMRDEVYAFFIRWVYQTGNYTNSYHIPGRSKFTTDAELVTDPDDVIDVFETETWQVYDTSTIDEFISDPQEQHLVDKEFQGYYIAKGKMQYWESTERYPSDQPEVWGSLCGQPIRHHKFPSNSRLHIHDKGGENINILGVQFRNIKQPVDLNGVPVSDIVGYEILRGSREGNRSIVAKGIFNNMRQFPYDDDGDNSTAPKQGLFQNYPYNDLNRDGFLTRDPDLVFNGSAEKTHNNNEDKSGELDELFALTVYRKDYLSFHSPETTFNKPYLGSGTIVRLYGENVGEMDGRYRFPDKHPEHVLITDFAFFSAVGLGFALALTRALGKQTTGFTIEAGFSLVVSAGIATQASRAPGETPAGVITDGITNGALNAPGLPGLIMGTIGFILQFGYFMGRGIDEVLRAMRALTRDNQYALQFNSHCFYDDFYSRPNGKNITRVSVKNGVKYIGRGVQRINADRIVNNLNRNKYVCVHTNGGVPDPSQPDTTRQRLIDLAKSNYTNEEKLYENPNKIGIQKPSSAWYGALMFDFQNQYGQIRSIVQIPVSECITNTVQLTQYQYEISTSPVIFGGDIYINRYTEKNPYYFFNTWLYDVDNGTEIDYRQYINGPLPRYWANFYKFTADDFELSLRQLFERDNDSDSPPLDEGQYVDGTSDSDDNDSDFGDDANDDSQPRGFLKRIRERLRDPANGGFLDTIMRTPSDFHRLDRRKWISGWMRVKDSYFYLFYNGIRDFYCESELNLAFRDWSENIENENFYDVYNHSFDDIDLMFRSDKITNEIYYKYDLSLSVAKMFNQFFSWGKILPTDYDPEIYSTCFQYFPRRSVYSLRQVEGLKRDNWRNYLALNFRDFPGRVSTIKSLNKVGAVILFEDAEPILFTGTDTIQTDGGTKYSIGDAALFADNNLKSMVNADDQLAFGTCISSRSAINTPHGMFYMSQDSGKIFQYAGQLIEISKNGMKHWFAENLPSYLRETNPDYVQYDNPVIATGCQTIYDPTYELVYFMKRDYTPIDLEADYQFDSPNGIPYTLCSPTEDNTVVPDPTQDETCIPSCPEGYTLQGDSCVKEVITTPILDGGTQLNVAVGDQVGSFSGRGIRILPDISSNVFPVYAGLSGTRFANDADGVQDSSSGTTGVGTIIDPLVKGLQSPLWGEFNQNTGRLNMTGVRIGAARNNIWYGATICITVTEPTEQIIISMSTDNMGRFSVNGELWFSTEMKDSGDRLPFEYWWAIPITLPAGDHKIFFEGMSIGGNLGIGFEIYRITLSDFLARPYNAGVDPVTLTGVNTATEADILNDIFFSAESLIGQVVRDPDDPGQYICNGVVIEGDICSNAPDCVEYLIESPSACADCNLVASETTVATGNSIELIWNGTGDSINSNFGASTLSGAITITNVTEDTTYWIEVTSSDGFTKVCSVEIKVKCECAFTDPSCFNPACWTVSYDPKNKMWVSFHDWCPTLVMPSNQHFNTILYDSIWQHNDRYDLYANYYGVDYPWEVEYPIVNPPAINTLRNIEYTLEVFTYKNQGKDIYHILDENFDRAVLYNSEQISGLLKLNVKGKNTPAANLTNNASTITTGDILGTQAYNIQFSKEENKYRFNKFFDITNDREEFNPSANPEYMFTTRPSGFRKDINELFVDYNKPFTQRKKFRHYGNRLILRKTESNDRKMVLKLVTTKQLLSRI